MLHRAPLADACCDGAGGGSNPQKGRALLRRSRRAPSVARPATSN